MNFQEEQEVVTLSEICRVCLMKTDNMKHLLEPNEEVIQIVRKLSSISNIEIELNGTLPSFLCAGCEEKLNSAYDFQQLCQKSHNFMLACVSASSVTFKVNSFKPIEFEDNPENQIQLQPENDPNSFVNLVENSGFEKKVNVDYCPLPEFADCNQNDENNIPIQNEVNVQETDTENCSMDNKLEIVKIEDDGTHEIPSISCEVEKRTKYNQTMRLPQYSPEEVNKVIQKTKERFFKRVNCLHCGFMAKDSRSLSVHMTRLHKDRKEQWCLWCNTNFENIQEHLSTVHKDDLKCPFCGKYKSKMGHFMEHLASHSIERKHICRECRKCFISERHLKNHCNQVHSTKKPFQCRYCPKAFSCPKSLNNHLRFHNKRGCKSRTDRLPSEDADNQKGSESEENESEKTCNNFCKICNKRVRSLPKHTKAFHSDGERTENKDPLHILCSYCGKRFKSMAKLTIHIRTHTGELPYKCSFCDKRMRTRIHLVVHERVHTGEKPHVCKFCGKAFAQSSVLNTHMKQHTGRTEECPTCQKRFCRPSELRLHMRTHTGEKPYECNICGQSFVQKSHLVGHSRKHSENRPYKCEFCSKAFKQPSSHRKHTNSHLKIFPYKCYICTFTTRQKSSLQEHILQHQKDPLSESMHKCEICDQYFMNFEIYSMHYTNEHGSLEEQCIMKDDLVGTSTTEVYIME